MAVNSDKQTILRLCRLHFAYASILATQVIIYHSWQLITPEAILLRWLMIGLLAITTAIVWYTAKQQKMQFGLFKSLVWLLVTIDIFVATFGIYTQRGMASRAVALYAVPLIVSAVLASRAAVFTTAVFCTVAYTSAALAYFVINFNEGYKIELYGEVGMYSACFFLVAALLGIVIRPKP